MPLLKELSNERFDVFERKGMTRFTGCQCFKDCSCADDFVSCPYHYYEVKRKKYGNSVRIKTTYHNTLESLNARIELLNNL